MSISSISAAGLRQYVLSTSSSSPLQQALQDLQNSLASGDLNGAQSAFQAVQKETQALATASGNQSSSSQLSTVLATLGGALSSGDLSGAQSALATVQSDLKSASSPSLTNETNAASESVQLVDELLSTVNVNSASSSDTDLATSVLEQVYGSPSGLNVHA